jgi:hypothetical protein
LLPSLHSAVHARGVRHTHAAPGPHRHTPDGSLHDVVEALGLHELAEEGGARVECALAPYTLGLPCETERPTFAALALEGIDADETPPAGDPFDPQHGDGAPEHLGVALIGSAPLLLPAALQVGCAPPLVTVEERPASRLLLPARARGPPRFWSILG